MVPIPKNGKSQPWNSKFYVLSRIFRFVFCFAECQRRTSRQRRGRGSELVVTGPWYTNISCSSSSRSFLAILSSSYHTGTSSGPGGVAFLSRQDPVHRYKYPSRVSLRAQHVLHGADLKVHSSGVRYDDGVPSLAVLSWRSSVSWVAGQL